MPIVASALFGALISTENPAFLTTLILVLCLALLGAATSVIPDCNHACFTYAIKQISKRFRAWEYLFKGPTILENQYRKANGSSFEVLAPDVRMIFVSSPEQIKELDSAPDSALSLNGAAKHMLQPLHTMNGFNWFDRRGADGFGFIRSLRTMLTNNIPKLLPDLGLLARTRWAQLLSNEKRVTDDGTVMASVYPMMMNTVVLLNARSLFGEDLIKNDKFMASALGFVEETLVNAEIIKLLPRFLAPYVGGILSQCLSSHKTFFTSLIPATEERVREHELKKLGHIVPERADCIQWLIETAPKNNPWSVERVIYELMAIWFGSVHILSTTIVYIIQDLCIHPEYVEELRDELRVSYAEFERTGCGLPLLDSFIRESARLTPVESMSVRRCALKPFMLSDGTQLAVGDWACAPSGAMNTNPEYYPSASSFSGFRFVDPAIFSTDGDDKTQASVSSAWGVQQPKHSNLTDVEHPWLMWGSGRMACPGRYYASAFMKAVVAQLLLNYDFTMIEPEATRWISWRVARIPRPGTKLKFTPRNQRS